MKPCLADVNVVLALLVRHHEHHARAMRWFDSLAAGEGALCRFMQLALISLHGNEVVMGAYVLSAAGAWKLIAELMEDERLEFAGEPALLDQVLPDLLKFRGPTGKLVSDAYLAGFSVAANMRLATFDKGFRQFRGLDLEPF